MYKIQLSNFEGPFDLLLYFIKRDELNIYDIPISKLSKEFLDYVQMMQSLNLDLAGEFIVMCSTLIHIKSQMLLPRGKDEDGNPAEDPRTELVRNLQEYKRIKESVEELKQSEQHTRFLLYRKNFEEERKEESEDYLLQNVNLFHIITAFQNILKRRGSENQSHRVNLYSYSISEQRDFILKRLNLGAKLSFAQLLENANRLKIVVTFLAMLDLIKTGEILVSQKENHKDINIAKVRVKN